MTGPGDEMLEGDEHCQLSQILNECIVVRHYATGAGPARESAAQFDSGPAEFLEPPSEH